MASRTATASRTIPVALVVAAFVGCGSPPPPQYPLADIVWQDDDMHPFGPRPPERYNSWLWDGVDNSFFRGLSEALEYRTSVESLNVNALDEVPDSSWFINRLGRYELTPEEVADGACEAGIPPRPWTVLKVKGGGTTPGLMVRDATGQRHIFKIDYRGQPERGTASDAISTRIVHAIGYATPCNRVVVFEREALLLDRNSDEEDVEEMPTRENVDEVLNAATPAPNGLLRGSLSRFIDGRLLGGWSFAGRNGHDLNDVIAHEHRREVRGQYVLSAWLNHVDAREANNMDVWVDTGNDQGYIQHYVLDAGDSLGITWPASNHMSRRLGESHYLDLEHVVGDFLTFGLVDRGYDESVAGPEHPVFGFYDVERFQPNGWRNGYSNPAYERRTERDAAWMARILARFSREHLAAVIEAGEFSRPEYNEYLLRVLDGRRQRVLERFLTRISPLSWPEVDGNRLCIEDLAVTSGIRDRTSRRYEARVYGGAALEATSTEQGDVCVTLPSLSAEGGEPPYVVIEIVASTVSQERTHPAQIHLYQTGPSTYQVVGLGRPG